MRPRTPHGFSLVEVLVALIAIGILVGTFLDRVLPLIGRAQRAAFVQVRADLQTALRLAAAERITGGGAASVQMLAGQNPMTLLLAPPDNYLGSFEKPKQDEMPAASWYFDERTRRLAYRVGRHTRFNALGGPAELVEFKTEFVFEDRNHDGTFEPGADEFIGLRLEPLHAFEWPD